MLFIQRSEACPPLTSIKNKNKKKHTVSGLLSHVAYSQSGSIRISRYAFLAKGSSGFATSCR